MARRVSRPPRHEYLDAVPEDPFDNGPLRYRREAGDGYLIYSIGEDFEDDGGVPNAEEKDAPQEGDLLFSVSR